MTHQRPSSRLFYIFPAIGVARVGDSRLHTYVANEAPLIDFVPRGGYRGPEEEVPDEERPYRLPEIDPAGPVWPAEPEVGGPPPVIQPPDVEPVPERRIKRMGCRFRLYELDAAGTVLGEITADDADIEWTVRLVNKKAAGDADWGYGRLTGPLNTGPSADELTIESDGTVAGVNAGPVEMAGLIMRGTVEERPVKLGDLETDRKGRLVVYGGYGVAGSWERPSSWPHLIRNAGWYDDTSDGTVDATVTIDGVPYEAVGARIVVGPPDYVHPCIAPVTLFDLAFDRSGGSYADTSFTEHIHPMLHRVAFLEWTLFGIVGTTLGRTPKHGHGFTGNHDMHPHGAFLDRRVFDTLHDPNSSDGADRRDFYFRWLKDPAVSPPHGGQGEPGSMPAIEGLTLTPVQYTHFDRLNQGAFISDWPSDRDPADRGVLPFHQIRLAGRPAALNRAAMDFAVGGPFLPGVEVGAIAADSATYVSSGLPDPEIDFRVADSVEAGDLTQSLAVPWQAALNHHNYDDGAGVTADNLWPSARPVLVPAKRGGVDDHLLWTRPHTQSGHDDIFENQKLASNVTMIEIWSKLGFIAPRTFYVEISRTLPEEVVATHTH